MDMLSRIAARIANNSVGDMHKCAQCGNNISSVEEISNALCDSCVRLGPIQPATIIAARKKSKKSKKSKDPLPQAKSILTPGTEYSINIDISTTATFEGTASKNKLLRKFEMELQAAIKQAVDIVSREFRLEPTGVMVKPLSTSIAVTDMTTSDDYESSDDEDDDD